jgi:hypothetical protein
VECNVEYKYLYRRIYHDIDAVVHETGAAINSSGRNFLFSLTDNGGRQFQDTFYCLQSPSTPWWHLLKLFFAFNSIFLLNSPRYREQASSIVSIVKSFSQNVLQACALFLSRVVFARLCQCFPFWCKRRYRSSTGSNLFRPCCPPHSYYNDNHPNVSQSQISYNGQANLRSANGPMNETCVLTFTPVNNVIQEVQNCTMSMGANVVSSMVFNPVSTGSATSTVS